MIQPPDPRFDMITTQNETPSARFTGQRRSGEAASPSTYSISYDLSTKSGLSSYSPSRLSGQLVVPSYDGFQGQSQASRAAHGQPISPNCHQSPHEP